MMKFADKIAKGPGTIYIISNVSYPEETKIHPVPGDVLVMLNTAVTASYYDDVPEGVQKIVIHRKGDPEVFGEVVPGWENYNVMWDFSHNFYMNYLSKRYNWINPATGKRCHSMSTGYIVAMYLDYLKTGKEIVLVNFGYGVKHSTFRSAHHNWLFESKALEKFKHLYTELDVEQDD